MHKNGTGLFQESLLQARERHRTGVPVWQYFSERVRSHHEADRHLPSKMLPGDDGTASLSDAANSPQPGRKRVIYLHTPYCPAICSFCAFFRQPQKGADLDKYVEALLTQIKYYSESAWSEGEEVSAIYFGGGTPTVLSAHHFESILDALRDNYKIASDAEITVESRCHGMIKDYWKRLCSAGVNRVSLGIQSFDSSVRRHVGRFSSSEEIESAVEILRGAGIQCLSGDLIYNLPRQSLEIFQKDLSRLNQLGFDGSSVYCLIPFPNSTLMKRIEEGKEEPMGGMDSEFKYFSAASEFFEKKDDWKRVSSVHFARGSKDRNRYNQVRSGHADVLGLGCGAGGRLGAISYMNYFSIEKYIHSQELKESGSAMVFQSPTITPELASLRHLPESLTVDRSPSSDPFPAEVAQTVGSLEALGLVEESPNCIRMTEAGCFWAYNIGAILSSSIHAAINAKGLVNV